MKKRTFIIGEEWLYYKIYCGNKTADIVLKDVIKPIVTVLLLEDKIDQWFFIRYYDPESHLRVRFHLTNNTILAEVITILKTALRPFIEHDFIWKVQIDSYNRELERYGEHTIEEVEQLFFYDSEMIVNCIDVLEEENDEDFRLIFSMKTVDDLLTSFKLSLQEKLQLINGLQLGFKKEQQINKQQQIHLDTKFRIYKKRINEIFEGDKNYEFAIFLALKNEKSQATIDKIVQKKENLLLTISLSNLLGSILHMTLNRFFRSEQRVYEMITYDFLYRYYKSKIAIEIFMDKDLSNKIKKGIPTSDRKKIISSKEKGQDI